MNSKKQHEQTNRLTGRRPAHAPRAHAAGKPRPSGSRVGGGMGGRSSIRRRRPLVVVLSRLFL
eukprot:5997937-Pyramimonas_sp.AAC.1